MSNNSNTSHFGFEGEAYVNHLLKDGALEPIESRELALPEWYNESDFKKSQNQKHRFSYSGTLFGTILLGTQAMLAIESALTILMLTKQSNTPKMAYKRYMQTIAHVSSWYRYSLQPGTIAWQSIEYVRQAHVKASEMAKRANKGMITQKDMALTQFALIGFGMLEADNIPNVDQRFIESTIALWRLTGYLLGIKDEYNLCTESWQTSRPRFYSVLEKVVRPALENPGPNFDCMSRVFSEGMRSELLMSYDLSIAIIKLKSGCEGYKTLSDTLGNLGLFDAIYLRIILFNKYIYRYFIFRTILNVLQIISACVKLAFPVVAIMQFGWKWAYSRSLKM